MISLVEPIRLGTVWNLITHHFIDIFIFEVAFLSKFINRLVNLVRKGISWSKPVIFSLLIDHLYFVWAVAALGFDLSPSWLFMELSHHSIGWWYARAKLVCNFWRYCLSIWHFLERGWISSLGMPLTLWTWILDTWLLHKLWIFNMILEFRDWISWHNLNFLVRFKISTLIFPLPKEIFRNGRVGEFFLHVYFKCFLIKFPFFKIFLFRICRLKILERL